MYYLRLRLIIPVMLLLSTLSAQQKIASTDLKEDLNFLQEALYRGHPGTFLFTTKDSLDLFFNQLRAQLKVDSIPYEQAQVTIRLAVARIRDGHTSVQTAFYDDSTRVLPFTIQVLGERVYILRNYSGDTTLHKGDELRSINDDPVAGVVRIGKLLASGDGFNRSYAAAVASVYFARYQTLLFGVRPINKILALNPSGKSSEHFIAVKTRAEMLKLLQKRSTKPLPDQKPVLRYKDMALRRDSTRSDLAVLQMGSFPNGHYKKFYRRMFKWLDDKHIQNLAIDLRYNTGGNIYNMDFLVSKIVDQPFGYQYERNRHASMGHYFNWKAKLLKSLAWMKYNFTLGFRHKRNGPLNIRSCAIKPRHRDNFNGKVFVLTNGWSFSSASMCASFLKNKAAAVTIGTETGGNEAGNCGGSYPKLILPNTKFKIRFPLYHLRYDIGKPDVGRGVLPDYPTPYRIGDVLEARDLEMEKVYELLKGQ